MLPTDTIDDILACLDKGYFISRCPMRQSGLKRDVMIAGRIMGLTESDWWYILRESEAEGDVGLLTKQQFMQLFNQAYIRRVEQAKSEVCAQYVLNSFCRIGKYSRYAHKSKSLKERIEKP